MFFLCCFVVLPSPVFNVTVTERQSNKLMLSWTPGHDGFSPLTSCHIRVSFSAGQAVQIILGPPIDHFLSASRPPKVKEVSRRKGEVTTTRFVNVTVPPFYCEVPGLKAMTSYNMSVSCSNEVGSSPVSVWVQSNTTEGGVFIQQFQDIQTKIQIKGVQITICSEKCSISLNMNNSQLLPHHTELSISKTN